MSLDSAIYEGSVRHRRFTPTAHEFTYRVCMIYVNLAELAELLESSPLWSSHWWGLARFRRKDFHGDPRVDLVESIKRTIEQALDFRPQGKVCMLANFRYFGFNINPLTTYYCFDKSGKKVDAIVAEVTNTPWKERRAYVLDFRDKNVKHIIEFEKDFTVSPFNTLDMTYRWVSTLPGDTLTLHIDTQKLSVDQQKKQAVTDATLTLVRREISHRSLHRVLFSFPLMTIQVAWGIYWQALRLSLKGVPFYGKDKTSKNVENRS